MDHLKYLSWVNYFFGAMALLSFGLLLLGMLASVGLTLSAGGEISAVLPSVIGLGVGSLVLLVVSILHFLAGSGVAKGRRRGLQTVLAVLTLPNCPGLFYGIYALWVCWGNEPTKHAFEEGGVF